MKEGAVTKMASEQRIETGTHTFPTLTSPQNNPSGLPRASAIEKTKN